MKNKKQKIHLSGYRKQLIQLAKVYGITEIKNYFKSAKRLTNNQLELILIKNKIKLPARKSLSNFSNFLIFTNKYLNQAFYSFITVLIVIGFFGGVPYLVKSFHKIDYNFWNNKNEVAKYNDNNIDKILQENKTNQDKENIEEIAIDQKEEEEETDNTISLNASIINSLFDDHNYDLSDIRKGKKVKPFYISLLPKDIATIENIKERKELFIKIILPLILQENATIIQDRKKLFKILAKKSNNKYERNWLKFKFKEYKIKNSDISELKIRMDIVPVSLAIAQAAIESGWGTSRFALEGNALFGQWTWSEKGLKPLDVSPKDKENTHRVMQFKIITASIKAYKKNLNTHSGYKQFREARADLRSDNEKPTGLKLTKYLDNYAMAGDEYIKKIELTIKKNKLSDFENAKLFSVGLRKGINL